MSDSQHNLSIPPRYEHITRASREHIEELKKFNFDGIVKLVAFPEAVQAAPPYQMLSDPTENEIHSVRHHAKYSGHVSDIGLYFTTNAKIRGSGYVVKDGKRLYGPDLIPDYVEAAIDNGSFEELNNDRQRSEVHISKPTALLCNEGYLIYGHWLVDLIPKAWMFFSQFGTVPDDIIYPFCDDVPEYGLNMLSMVFGMPRDNILIYNNRTDDLCVDKLVVPSLMHNNHIFHPAAAQAIAFVRDKVLQHEIRSDTSKKASRIYVSRQKFRNKSISSKRFIDNEDELIFIAKSSGFDVIYPEEHSWAEQVRIFSDAKLIIGEAGSGMHNTLFSSSDAHVLSICDSQLQGTLAALLGQKLTLIGPEKAYWEENTMHFHINAERFAKAVQLITS